jgi:hypothetical protein
MGAAGTCLQRVNIESEAKGKRYSVTGDLSGFRVAKRYVNNTQRAEISSVTTRCGCSARNSQVERLSNEGIRIATTRISRSQTSTTTTVYARVSNRCGRGAHSPFGRI